jgi:hypothetical protein
MTFPSDFGGVFVFYSCEQWFTRRRPVALNGIATHHELRNSREIRGVASAGLCESKSWYDRIQDSQFLSNWNQQMVRVVFIRSIEKEVCNGEYTCGILQ